MRSAQTRRENLAAREFEILAHLPRRAHKDLGMHAVSHGIRQKPDGVTMSTTHHIGGKDAQTSDH